MTASFANKRVIFHAKSIYFINYSSLTEHQMIDYDYQVLIEPLLNKEILENKFRSRQRTITVDKFRPRSRKSKRRSVLHRPLLSRPPRADVKHIRTGRHAAIAGKRRRLRLLHLRSDFYHRGPACKAHGLTAQVEVDRRRTPSAAHV